MTTRTNKMNVIKLIERADTPGGYVELWDFSRANESHEARVEAVTAVASICFGSNKAIGSDKLYNKLAAESIGLPSSSFEFVPVLLKLNSELCPFDELVSEGAIPHFMKYGTLIKDGQDEYILTNYRALLYDIEMSGADKEKWINGAFNKTSTEQSIIRKNFVVTKHKLDIATARQYMRHRDSWQELSRRYTTGKKVPVEVYLDSSIEHSGAKIVVGDRELSAQDVVDISIEMYNELLKNGVKAQDARRVLPIGLKTEVWSARNLESLSNFYSLRTESKAQDEIREIAKAMKTLTDKHL